MIQERRNIYQISREIAGLTQERAAELVNTSVESIRAYEGDKRRTPDDIALRMIEIYGTQFLAYQHLKKVCAEIGKDVIPDIEQQSLPESVLRFIKELNDFLKCKDELIEITCDGEVTPEERPVWERITKELEDVYASILSLKFAK